MPSVTTSGFDFRPEAAISGPLVVAYDGLLLLSFNAVHQVPSPGPKTDRAVIVIVRPLIHRLGYPNDKALRGHPLYRLGMDNYGCYEVLGSRWKAEIDEQYRVDFPDCVGFDVWHFALVFHDSMFECLAQDFRLRSTRGPDDEHVQTALRDF